METLAAIFAGLLATIGGWFSPPPQVDTLGAFGDVFLSVQVGTTPANGECLTTDGTNSVWDSCSSGAGDITGASSLGTGSNLFDSESAGVLRFNTIAAGTNVTFASSSNANTIVISSTGGGTGTVSTSTNETQGGLPYWTTTSGTPARLGSIATSTFTVSGPFIIPPTLGTLVGGTNSSITYTGLATTSQPSSSNLLVSNGGAGVYGVGTTTVTCGTGTSCTTFTTLGATPITITASGVFPFTPTSYGNSTSSVIAFTQGIISHSSTTIPYLGNGFVGANNGRLYSFASSTTGYVPYTGATADVELGNFALNSSGYRITNGTIDFKTDEVTTVNNLYSDVLDRLTFGGYASGFEVNLDSNHLTATRIYDFPDVTGTIGVGISTTSPNLAYWRADSGLGSVATTSVTCSGNTTCTTFTAIGASPITISSTGGGTGLSTTSPVAGSNVLTYSAAGAGSAYGTATTTFALTSFPAVLTGTVGALVGGANSSYTWTGLATSSAVVQSNLFYSSGGAGVANVATSTRTYSGPFTNSGTLGAQVGGTASVITWTGLATTTQPASSNLLVSNGGAGVFGVATGTASCTTGVSCTSFTVIGSSPSITSTLGTAIDISDETNLAATWPSILTGDTISFGGLSTSTAAVQGNLPYFSGVNTFANVATTTLAGTSNQISISNSPVVIGASGAVLTLPSLVIFPSNASSTLFSTTYASSTDQVIGRNFTFGGVTADTWPEFCATITGTTDLCDDDDTGAGGAFPFTPNVYGAQAVNSTTTGIWATSAATPYGLIASSTFTTYASTTQLSIGSNLYFDSDTFDSLTDDATLANNAGDLQVVDVTCTGCLGTTEVAGLDISDDTNLAATWPVILTGDTLSFGGLSTTSPIAAGAAILYATGVNTVASIATSSLAISGPFLEATGLNVIGASGAVTYTGLATTSQPSQSNLLYSSGGAGVAGVATTTLSTGTGVTVSAGAGALVGGTNATVSLTSISGGVLGSVASAIPTAQATSTLYGVSTGGMVLGWNNVTGGIAWVATSSAAGGVTAVTATAPIFSSGGATPNITWAGLATTTAITQGHLLYSSGGAGVTSVATTSVTAGTGVTFTGTAGALVGGTALTINTPWTISGGDIFNNNLGNTSIGTSTQTNIAELTVGSSTASQLSLSSNTAGVAQWTFRNAGGLLYIATTTTTGTATSSPAAITVNGNAGTKGLFVGTTTNANVTGLAVAGTGAWSGLTVESGVGSVVCVKTDSTIVLDDSPVTACSGASSIKVKHDVMTLSKNLSAILAMRPVSYVYNEDYSTDQSTHLGFIVEEIELILPNLVDIPTGDAPKGLKYAEFVAPIVGAIQELFGQLQSLVARVTGLEAQIQKQAADIDNLQAQINALRDR